MAPLDVVGTDIVGNVRAVNPSRPAAAAPGFAVPLGGSPLDDFLRQKPATSQPAPQPSLAVSPRDDPRFGRIAFSAGVGGVLIQLQAERPLEAEASASEVPHALAAYARAQSLSEPQRAALERPMRAVTIEHAGFWGEPILVDLLPMMV